MDTNELYQDFNTFAYELFNKKDELNCIKNNDILLKRICFHKLYYALYHKLLPLANVPERAPNKHQLLQDIIKQKRKDLFPILKKMYDLRIWADYKYNNDGNKTDLALCFNEVYRVIKQNITKI